MEALKMIGRDRICLHFLSSKMEATGRVVGEEIARIEGFNTTPRGCAMIGNSLVRRLRSAGLVSYLPDLNAWRITSAGREALQNAEKI